MTETAHPTRLSRRWSSLPGIDINWKLVIPALVIAEIINRSMGTSTTTLLTEILIFALFATSLNLLMSFGHMVSFGHSAYFGLGAYGFTLGVVKAGLPVEAAVVFSDPGKIRPERQAQIPAYLVHNAEAVELRIYATALQPGD